jgi:hypothetical protein
MNHPGDPFQEDHRRLLAEVERLRLAAAQASKLGHAERAIIGAVASGALPFCNQQGVASGFEPGMPRAFIGLGSQSARLGTESSRAPC